MPEAYPPLSAVRDPSEGPIPSVSPGLGRESMVSETLARAMDHPPVCPNCEAALDLGDEDRGFRGAGLLRQPLAGRVAAKKTLAASSGLSRSRSRVSSSNRRTSRKPVS